MKKVCFVALSLLCFVPFEAFGQTTYLYKCIKCVKDDGTIEKRNFIRYITFSGDVMYESDRDGFKIGTGSPFKYKGIVDGNSIYMAYTPPISGFGVTAGGWDAHFYYLVSSDKSTVNYVFTSFGFPEVSTSVYVRTTEAQVAKDKEQEQEQKNQYQLIR